MTVGELLKARRAAFGMTGQECAKKIGVAYSTYWCWEKDTRFPDSLSCERIETVLAIPEGTIFEMSGCTIKTARRPRKKNKGIPAGTIRVKFDAPPRVMAILQGIVSEGIEDLPWASQEAVWLRKFCDEIGHSLRSAVKDIVGNGSEDPDSSENTQHNNTDEQLKEEVKVG